MGVCVQQEAAGKVDSELAVVLASIATACKQISSLVQRSGISGMTGLAGAANIQVCVCTWHAH
jgi:fructose-1,6-bisphosphatase I